MHPLHVTLTRTQNQEWTEVSSEVLTDLWTQAVSSSLEIKLSDDRTR